MHAEARAFVAKHAGNCEGPVLEIGSRDINGGVRDLFPADGYHGIDMAEGNGVDEVADVCDFTARKKFATVVCCEVLEHYADPELICDRAYDLLKKGGVFIVTAAGPTRTPHSGVDGGPLRPGEHYVNISAMDLADWLTRFDIVEIDELGADVRAVAVK